MSCKLLRLLQIATGILALCSLVAVVVAPYLPRLLLERYPQPRWPVPGYFADLTGSADARPYTRVGKLDAQSRALLTAKSGKVLLIHQGGKLRVAHYEKGVAPATKFNSYSLAKSLMGALLLKAVAENRIKSLDDPIGRYLPQAGDTAFKGTSLRAFAQMRSGIAFKPDKIKSTAGPTPKDAQSFILNPFGPMVQLHMRGLNPMLADLRLDPAKLNQFSYQNANTAIIGAVLEAVYAQPLQVILSDKIWQKAGAANAHWRRYRENGAVTPYCCIYATASDWLRVALFLMNNGTPEAPFLPREMWQLYFGSEVDARARHNGYYGLHVYQNILDLPGDHLQGPFTFLFGSRGQVVYIMPQRQLVVIRFGEKVQRLHSTLRAAWRSVERPH